MQKQSYFGRLNTSHRSWRKATIWKSYYKIGELAWHLHKALCSVPSTSEGPTWNYYNGKIFFTYVLDLILRFFEQKRQLLTVFLNTSVDDSEYQLASISFFRALTISKQITLPEVSFREAKVNGKFFPT